LIAFLGFGIALHPSRSSPAIRYTRGIKVLKSGVVKADRGIMKRQLLVLNQRGEVVQEGLQNFL